MSLQQIRRMEFYFFHFQNRCSTRVDHWVELIARIRERDEEDKLQSACVDTYILKLLQAEGGSVTLWRAARVVSHLSGAGEVWGGKNRLLGKLMRMIPHIVTDVDEFIST